MIQTTEMAAVKDTAGEPNGDDKALGKEAFAESPKVFVKSLPTPLCHIAYNAVAKSILEKIDTKPNYGFDLEDTRGCHYADTLRWLDSVREASFAVHKTISPKATLEMALVRQISTSLINTIKNLDKIYRWLQPACSFAECNVYLALGRLFTHYVNEQECAEFVHYVFSPLLEKFERFLSKKVPMATLDSESLKNFDVIHGLMLGVYSEVDICQMHAHVELYEQPDDWHPIQFYYWFASATNFFRGIWKHNAKSFNEIRELTPFMQHVIVKLVLKIAHFVEQVVKQDKNYFLLIVPVLASFSQTAFLLVHLATGEDGEIHGNTRYSKIVLMLYEKLFKTVVMGMNYADGDQFKDSIVIAINTLLMLSHISQEATPETVFAMIQQIITGIFNFIGRQMGKLQGQLGRPAEYPGFYPPIGFVLVAQRFGNDDYELFARILCNLTIDIPSPCERNFFAYIAKHIGKEQPALMALSFSTALLCVPIAPVGVERLLAVFQTLVAELTQRGQLTRRAVYWITFSLFYATLKNTERCNQTQKELFKKYFVRPTARLESNVEQLTERLRRLLEIESKEIPDKTEFLECILSSRLAIIMSTTKILLCRSPEFFQESLSFCLHLSNNTSGPRWRKRQGLEFEGGFQEVVSDFQTTVARYSVEDRVKILETLTNGTLSPEQVVMKLNDVFTKYPWPASAS